MVNKTMFTVEFSSKNYLVHGVWLKSLRQFTVSKGQRDGHNCNIATILVNKVTVSLQ